MRIFGRNAAIGVVGFLLAVFAVAPAYADSGRHGHRAEHDAKHDRVAHLHHGLRHHAKRVEHSRRIVHHHRGRTIVVVPERHRRAAIGHGHHADPVIRALIRALNR